MAATTGQSSTVVHPTAKGGAKTPAMEPPKPAPKPLVPADFEPVCARAEQGYACNCRICSG